MVGFGSSLGTWCLVRAKSLGRFFVGHSFESNLGALGHGYYESRASKDIKGRPLDPVLDVLGALEVQFGRTQSDRELEV